MPSGPGAPLLRRTRIAAAVSAATDVVLSKSIRGRLAVSRLSMSLPRRGRTLSVTKREGAGANLPGGRRVATAPDLAAAPATTAGGCVDYQSDPCAICISSSFSRVGRVRRSRLGPSLRQGVWIHRLGCEQY